MINAIRNVLDGGKRDKDKRVNRSLILCSDYVVTLKSQIIVQLRHLNPGLPLFKLVDNSRNELNRPALVADHELSVNRGRMALDKTTQGFSNFPLNFFDDGKDTVPKTKEWIKNFIENQEFI